MKRTTTNRLVSFIPLIVGVTLLVISALFVPWSEVIPYLARLNPGEIAVLIALSAIYYLGRSLRYWLMLRMLGHDMSFKRVNMATLVAQPVAILPAGELYRSAMLKRYGGIELKDGIPSVFAQSVAETVGLLLIAIIGAVFLHQYAGFVIVLAIFFVALLLYIRMHNASHSHKVVNKLPKVSVSFPKLKSFLHKNRIMLTGMNFVKLLLISYVSTIAGIGIVLVTVAFIAEPLTLFEGSMAYVIPMMVQSLSFLPGGIGVNEQGSVGILVLFGLSLPVAVAATLIIRIFTLGVGFFFGFGAMAADRILKFKHYN